MSEEFTPVSVVVGIDGSRNAVDAALWAIEEANSRDVPLRLVAAAATGERGEADMAVRAAAAAVGASGRSVRIETHVADGAPVPTLLAASGLKVFKALKHGAQEDWTMLGLATVVAGLVSFLTVKWLLRYVQAHSFAAFGVYRILAGVLLLWIL